MNIADFDFDLPPEAIAQAPLAERDGSRLLVLDRATSRVAHYVFRDLADILRPGDLLVTNRSRVFPARLIGRRASGGAAELLLLAPLAAAGEWEALARPGRRLKPGETIAIGGVLTARVLSSPRAPDGRRRVRLETPDGAPLEEALQRVGRVPLPPYIRREDGAADRERYQTVYAREPGSVAAPTAGLHFTQDLFARLAARGIGRAEVVLHVGPGTFRPVQVEDVHAHRVAPEPFFVPEETAAEFARARASGGRVVAVGTTSVRTLESALDARGGLRPGPGTTDLVIVPGFEFRAVDALVTNFHLPRSSLLLLVAAFAGRERVLSAYAEAVRLGYRFYSYGDAMFLA